MTDHKRHKPAANEREVEGRPEVETERRLRELKPRQPQFEIEALLDQSTITPTTRRSPAGADATGFALDGASTNRATGTGDVATRRPSWSVVGGAAVFGAVAGAVAGAIVMYFALQTQLDGLQLEVAQLETQLAGVGELDGTADSVTQPTEPDASSSADDNENFQLRPKPVRSSFTTYREIASASFDSRQLTVGHHLRLGPRVIQHLTNERAGHGDALTEPDKPRTPLVSPSDPSNRETPSGATTNSARTPARPVSRANLAELLDEA